jgi:protoporphyrin/coproporphyrin ferrochelatase
MNESLPNPPPEGEPTDEPVILAALTAALAEPESPPAPPQVIDVLPAEHEAVPAEHAGLPAEAESAAAAPIHETENLAPLPAPAEEMETAPPAAPIEAPPMAPVAEELPPPAAAEAPEPAAAVAPASPTQAALDAAMPSAPAPVEHGIGVLLVNLGTPEAADPPAVRRYLKEFLSDRRVIEKDSLLWKFALNCIILPLRSARKARAYQKIWNVEKNESPIKTITRSQAEKLGGILEPLGKHVIVDWAMRYAGPSIGARLEALIKRGCERILIMPLYPQYAAPTTATVCDEAYRYMMGLRRQPALRILPAYYEDPYYIEVLASSLKAEIKGLPFEPDVILASYHGMPRQYVDKGDPYASQCVKTTELLRAQLGLDENKLAMSFQSRFGRGKWIEPYTIKTVKALAKKGVKNLVVVTPGFAADCIETLEEIAVDNARMFKRHGGKNFAHIPCLNDSEAGMLMIWQLAMRELKGWV